MSASTAGVHLKHDDWYPTRLYSHVVFGLSKEIQEHEANWKERLGNLGLWTVEVLPSKVLNATLKVVRDPRFVTIALTILALWANTYLFYPIHAMRVLVWTGNMLSMLPLPSLATCKFATYIYVCNAILSASLRAYGRFSNSKLMDDFDPQRIIEREQAAKLQQEQLHAEHS